VTATLGRADVTPGRAEFVAMAQSHAIVPVALEVVADTVTPVAAYVALVGEGEGFLLESAEGDERFGRYSFVGANVLGTFVRTASGTSTVTGALPAPLDGEGTLDYLARTLAALRTPALPGLPPLHSGLVGYLAYDVVREIERIAQARHDDLGHPDAALHLIGELLVFDHWRQRLTFLVNVAVGGLGREEVEQRYDAACARIDELLGELSGLPSLAPFRLAGVSGSSIVPPPSNRTSRDFRDAVAVAKEHIVAGDVFQVVLSQRFDYELTVPAISVYRALRILNPSPYLYLLRLGGWTVLGSSPEALVQLRDGRATMRPIAGSRPRGANERADALLEAELKEDPKERAEHIMLVDLGRNDLGRVCRYGTIVVEELMTVERFSHVTHLTSQVAGEVAEGIGPVDVLRATLPAGTLSGAPKVRAMQIINELEPTRRGVYGGVVGYLDLCGNLDTAIAIRTLVVGPDGHGSVQAGAGIVVDSDPATEDLECRAKAAALFSALAAAEALHAAGPTSP
jgi:anthranilate synthase component 1